MPNWKKVIVSGSNAELNQVSASFSGSFQGDGSQLTGVGSSITIQDEGSNLTTAASQINFVGSGVTATTSGNNVTANDASGLSVFYSYDDNGDIQPQA